VDLSKAMTTADGCIVELDGEQDAQPHPKYKLPSYRAVIEIALRGPQKELLQELLRRGGLEEVHRSTRSSVDQLGLFGCDSASTTVRVDGDKAIVETRIAMVDRDPRNKLLAALRAVVHTKRAQYCRLLLTPAESKHGERSLPILPDREVWYDHDQLTQESLEALWLGAPGRQTILPAKRERPMPATIRKGQFFIGEVHAMDPDHSSKEHLWVLKRRVRQGAWNKRTSLRHGDACGFDPHRSTGIRQGEFFLTGGPPLKTDDLIMIAEQFELDYENSNGTQHTGI
jgi:hypothetical protein